MNFAEINVKILALIEKLTASTERKINYMKELADDRISLKAVLADQEAGTELDTESGYVTYNEWVEGLSKEIKTGESSLERIEFEKAEIIALQYYIDNAAE